MVENSFESKWAMVTITLKQKETNLIWTEMLRGNKLWDTKQKKIDMAIYTSIERVTSKNWECLKRWKH